MRAPREPRKSSPSTSSTSTPPAPRGSDREGRQSRADRLGNQNRPSAAPSAAPAPRRPAVPGRYRPRTGPPARSGRPRPRLGAGTAVLPASRGSFQAGKRRRHLAPTAPLAADTLGRGRNRAPDTDGQKPPHQPEQPGDLRQTHVRRRRRSHRGHRPRPPALIYTPTAFRSLPPTVCPALLHPGQASSTSFPQLTRVLVWYADRVGVRQTLQQALTRATQSAPVTTPVAAPGVHRRTGGAQRHRVEHGRRGGRILPVAVRRTGRRQFHRSNGPASGGTAL